MKFTPGPLAGQLSGKIGNTVASHSRTGAYFRLKAIPVNPQSDAQLDLRGQFAGLTKRWRTLTDSARLGWTNVALDINRSDSLGQSYNLTGLQAYVSNNINRILAGQAITDNAPVLDDPVVLTSLSVDDWSTSTLSTAFAPTPIGANQRLKIFATRPLSAGIAVPGKGEFRLIAVSAANDASPTDFFTAYTAKYGAYATDAHIWIRAVPVSPEFWDGVPQQLRGLVT